MKELEAEIWCPLCRSYYGKVWRVKTDIGWKHESEPAFIPKYCGVCDKPTERHYAA